MHRKGNLGGLYINFPLILSSKRVSKSLRTMINGESLSIIRRRQIQMDDGNVIRIYNIYVNYMHMQSSGIFAYS